MDLKSYLRSDLWCRKFMSFNENIQIWFFDMKIEWIWKDISDLIFMKIENFYKIDLRSGFWYTKINGFW